jgi:hypothetical protein
MQRNPVSRNELAIAENRRHGEEREENNEEKEGVIDTVTALAMCLAARRS